jgi:cobalt/nickel transport system permease protein
MRADLGAFAGLDSPVHRARASWKLGLALAFIIAVMLVPLAWAWVLVVPAGLLLAALLASRLPLRFFFRRLLALEPFVAGVAVLAWLQPNGHALAALVFARSSLCIAAAILLGATTPFVQLLEVFKRVGVPAVLVTVLALMSRYIYVLGDEAERLERARRSRTFVTRRRLDWSTLAALVGQLFIRATNRAERIYAAMCARGWR